MKITAVATVFPVTNLPASLRFYTEILQFKEEFRFGAYAGVERDHILLHLSQAGNPNTSAPGTAAIYIFCDNADDFHADILAHGGKPNGPPENYPYGMRDFLIQDPDGNRITIGSPTTPA